MSYYCSNVVISVVYVSKDWIYIVTNFYKRVITNKEDVARIFCVF